MASADDREGIVGDALVEIPSGSLASPNPVTRAPDPVAEALGDALSAWRIGHDPRALRRLLITIIGELDGVP